MCDSKVHLHENGSGDMLHLGNGNGLIDSEGEELYSGGRLLKGNRSTEDF